MAELLKIVYLNGQIRTCFFYISDRDLRGDKFSNSAVKISFGDNFEQITYGSINPVSHSEVPEDCIGVSSLLAGRLGLKEHDEVLVSPCDVNSVNSLQIYPQKEEDYIILLTCKSILEIYLLNQVRVVAEGQILPLYVFSNIVIDVEIGKLEPNFKYGQLEKFTEVTVLKFTERQKSPKCLIPKNETAESNFNTMFAYISRMLDSIGSLHGNSRQVEHETNLQKLLKQNEDNKIYSVIKPNILLTDDDSLKKIMKKYIISSKAESLENICGPYSTKIFSKVQKPEINQVKDRNATEDNLNVYTFVIGLDFCERNTAFCPQYLMKKLNLFAGSVLKIEKVNVDLNILSASDLKTNDEIKNCFWESIETIRKDIKLSIVNNIKNNFKINTLVVGDVGTGKTFLLQDIAKEFSEEFIYSKILHCKSLRGKKVEKLHKILTDHLKECCCYEPSILIVDDLHVLTYVDEKENESINKFYSNRVVDLILEYFQDFQKNYNVTILASAINLSQLSNLNATHGPRLFPNIHKIPEMSLAERHFALNHLIKTKGKDGSFDLNKLAQDTKGYAIQDLNDLVEKAIFNSILRNEKKILLKTNRLRRTEIQSVNITSLSLSQEDFESVFPKSVPVGLRDIKLGVIGEHKWEDIGGMTEPKKILTEIFFWPSKYSEILESCPLRLQKGVLLYGVPGTGKTILAGALAEKCGLNFLSVKGPEVLSKYIGASEEGVRNLFIQAQKMRPCLLFFDEFDSLAPKRGQDNTGVTDRVVNQLLTQLDGVEPLNGVWVLAATSRPDILDPALLRPGRLDKLVFCAVPNKTERLSIIQSLSKNLPTAENVNFVEIVEELEGYTGADLQALLYNAQMAAIKEKKDSLGTGGKFEIEHRHLLQALSETKPSMPINERIRYEERYEKFIVSRKRNCAEIYAGTQKVTLA